MGSYGRSVVAQIGTSARLSADGRPEVKSGGVTLDWTLSDIIPALAAFQLTDGVQIEPGDLYLRYGQLLCLITASGNIGYYGPYNPAATDGRQTLTNGQCFLLNRTVKYQDLISNHPEVIEGGKVFLPRLLVSGNTTGTAPASAPTFSATGGGSSGGTLAAGTYYLKSSVVTGGVETPLSAESTQMTVSSGNKPRVTFPAGAPAAGSTINLYATAANGAAGSEVIFASGITTSTYDMVAAAPTLGTAGGSISAGPTLAALLAVMPRLRLVAENPS